MSVSARHLGASLVQSVGSALTLGTTLRVLRGTSAAGTAPAAPTASLLEAAGSLSGPADTKFDVDVGALAVFGPIRLGVVGRNLRRPELGAGSPDSPVVRLARQVRVGIALTPGRVGVPAAPGGPSWTLAADIDLTRMPAAGGVRRNVAAGVERWLFSRRVGIRGGARASTVGPSRPVAAAGGSVQVRSALLVEGQLTRGGRDAERAWSVAGRVTF